MSASATPSFLHRLLCLLLALSLAMPALGLAQSGMAAPQASAADERALAMDTQADAPCPMHAKAAADSTHQATAPAGSEVADCCKKMAAADHACGDDCGGCDAGCGALRLPAGLESLGLIPAPVGPAGSPISARAPERADAPQPNLLRPPALG